MIKKREFILLVIPCILLALPLIMRWNSPKAKQKLKPNKVYKPQSGPVPRFVTYHLGGANLLQAKAHSKYDLKNKYHFSIHHGPNNCDRGMSLQHGTDIYAFYDAFTESERKEKYKNIHIPLVTWHGVRIENPPSQVRNKIGEPTSKNFEASNMTYKYEYRGPRIYQAWYTFRKGKLRSIEFRDAAQPGKLNNFRSNGGCP